MKVAQVPIYLDGSSPLTRGKLLGVAVLDEDSGLIPAHAGKTGACLPDLLPTRAHPRSRGENTHAACARVAIDGSSPLTRGKRYRWTAHAGSLGLIPAHAGKTHF